MTDRKHERGFTLLEVIVAISIVTITLVPLLHSFYLNEKTASEVQTRDIALFLAQSKLEEFKTYTFEDLVDINKSSFENQPGYFYSLSVEREGDYLKRLTVTVYYTLQDNEKKLLLTGFKAPCRHTAAPAEG